MIPEKIDEPGKNKALAFTVLVHAGLIAALFFGVQWKRNQPDVVEVELWSSRPASAVQAAPPPPPPPPQEVKPEPKPEPKPAPKLEPKPEPPPPRKPDIAIKEEKKPPKPEPKKPEPEPKPEPKKPEAKPEPKKPEAKPEPKPEAQPEARPETAATGPDDVAWQWPSSGKVISPYSDTGNKGIDFGGKSGDPVMAAADGKVVYVGTGIRGFGQLLIVKHNATFLSAYAHNRKILVAEGQQVTRGQKIAEMGNTDSDMVKLHFEIRKQGKPTDPLAFLPKR